MAPFRLRWGAVYGRRLGYRPYVLDLEARPLAQSSAERRARAGSPGEPMPAATLRPARPGGQLAVRCPGPGRLEAATARADRDVPRPACRAAHQDRGELG